MRSVDVGACMVLVAASTACAAGSDTPRDTAAEIGEGSDGTSGTTGTTASTSTSTSTTTSDGECVPGQQIECACPGGAPGAQACLPDGSGYSPCECPGDDATTAVDSSGAELSSSDDGTNEDCATCGTAALAGECDVALETCLADVGCSGMAACVQRCGLTAECVLQCQDPSLGDVSLSLFAELSDCVGIQCPICFEP